MRAAGALRAQGANVVDFGAGEPVRHPDSIKQAAQAAMRAGKTKYTSTGGTRELQQAIIDFYAGMFGANYERNEVMATAGGKQAIFNAVVSLINPGDEVLMAKPYWVTFPEIVLFAGGIPVFIETADTGFVLTAEQVEKSVSPRTRLIILNSPCNPSGRVIPPEEFQRIVELMVERGIYVITDECYLRFVYPPAQVFSAASLPAKMRARMCIAGSFSKTYAMTGWRVGYALASREWTRDMLTVQGHSTSNPNSIAQSAAIEALRGPQDSVATMLGEYTERRAWLLDALKEIPRLSCDEPEGAFYAFPSVRECLGGAIATSADFADRLCRGDRPSLRTVAAFSAKVFADFLRYLDGTVTEGVARIKRFVERLQN